MGEDYGSQASARGQGDLALENAPAPDYTVVVRDNFKEFEATTLFCGRCKQATAVRKRLLLVLPTGNKYDYACGVCGTTVGGKTDNDARDFHATRPPARRLPDLRR
jgi:hypothetical protein